MRLIDFIRDRARYYNCPVCGRGLDGSQLRMMQQSHDRCTVHVTCAMCQTQFVVLLAVQGAEAFESEEFAIASAHGSAPAPAARPEPPREPIRPDELLDLHLLLSGHHGPLTELLPQPSGERS